MRGRLLEFPGEQEYNKGRKVGIIEVLDSLVRDGLIDEDTAIEHAQAYGISLEEFRKALASCHPKDDKTNG